MASPLTVRIVSPLRMSEPAPAPKRVCLNSRSAAGAFGFESTIVSACVTHHQMAELTPQHVDGVSTVQRTARAGSLECNISIPYLITRHIRLLQRNYFLQRAARKINPCDLLRPRLHPLHLAQLTESFSAMS